MLPRSLSEERSDETKGAVLPRSLSEERSDETKGGERPRFLSEERSDETKGAYRSMLGLMIGITPVSAATLRR